MRVILLIIIILIVTGVVFFALTPQTAPNGVSSKEDSEIISKATDLYQESKESGTDFSNGPCLGVIDDYAVDITHNPREQIDELPENQCQAYINGDVSHFIELTPGGTFIRKK